MKVFVRVRCIEDYHWFLSKYKSYIINGDWESSVQQRLDQPTRNPFCLAIDGRYLCWNLDNGYFESKGYREVLKFTRYAEELLR